MWTGQRGTFLESVSVCERDKHTFYSVLEILEPESASKMDFYELGSKVDFGAEFGVIRSR